MKPGRRDEYGAIKFAVVLQARIYNFHPRMIYSESVKVPDFTRLIMKIIKNSGLYSDSCTNSSEQTNVQERSQRFINTS